MSDNTKQFRWITTIQGGLDALFRDDPNVFVALNSLLVSPSNKRGDSLGGVAIVPGDI